MAIIKSAKKAIRQNIRRREKNIVYKDKIKKLIKEILSLVAQNKATEAEKILPQAYKILDKAAKKGVINKNTASRRKSRLAKSIKKTLGK